MAVDCEGFTKGKRTGMSSVNMRLSTPFDHVEEVRARSFSEVAEWAADVPT